MIAYESEQLHAGRRPREHFLYRALLDTSELCDMRKRAVACSSRASEYSVRNNGAASNMRRGVIACNMSATYIMRTKHGPFETCKSMLGHAASIKPEKKFNRLLSELGFRTVRLTCLI